MDAWQLIGLILPPIVAVGLYLIAIRLERVQQSAGVIHYPARLTAIVLIGLMVGAVLIWLFVLGSWYCRLSNQCFF